MTDTVLESFCERCGTRYTFTEQEPRSESGRSKLGRLGRRTPEEAAVEPTVATALPTSARFDGTFNFCLECRQYACVNCWNSQAGYCVGCRPLGAPEVSGQTVSTVSLSVAATSSGAGRESALGQPTAWPTGDLDRIAAVATQGHAHTHVGTHTDPAAEPLTEVEAWPRTGESSAVDIAAQGAPKGAERSLESPTKDGVTTPNQPDIQASTRTIFERPSKPVDEWGRPIAKQPTKQPDAVATDLPFDTSQPAADPWQGVVFSERGETAGASAPKSTRPPPGDSRSETTNDEPLAEPPEQPAPDQMPPASVVWPESDKHHSTAPTVAAAALASVTAWPEVDRRGEVAEVAVAPEPEPEPEGVAAESVAEAEAEPEAEAVAEPEAATEPEPEAVAAESVAEAEAEPEAEAVAEPEAEAVAEPEAATEPEPEAVAAESVAEPEPPSAAQRILGLGAAAVGTVAISDRNAAPEPAQMRPAALLPPLPATSVVPPADAATTAPEAIAPVGGPNATLGFIEPADPVTSAETTVEHASIPRVVEPIQPRDVPPPPLAPIPTPVATANFGPGNAVAGPFAQPYQRPLDGPPMPPPVPPLGAIPIAPMNPQVSDPSTSTANTWTQARGPLPPQPQAPPQQQAPQPNQARPGFMAPPAASIVAPNVPQMPSAVKRTASQACASCRLPLSAKARFCRRCGAAQP